MFLAAGGPCVFTPATCNLASRGILPRATTEATGVANNPELKPAVRTPTAAGSSERTYNIAAVSIASAKASCPRASHMQLPLPLPVSISPADAADAARSSSRINVAG